MGDNRLRLRCVRLPLALGLGWLASSALALFAAPATALQPSDLPGCPSATRYCLALALWLPASRAADRAAWMTLQLQTANRLLGAVDAGVQVTAIHDLPKEHADIATTAQRTRLGRHGQQVPLRWFVVERLVDDADKTKTRRGVTWRDGQKVWVIEEESANPWVLAHELGHVLGLGHSGESWSVMNKTMRMQIATGMVEFTPRERPVMRRTLAALLAARRVGLAKP